MYILRTDDGKMIAKLENSVAMRWMDSSSGYYTEKNFVNGGKKRVYVFDEDGVTSMSMYGSGFKLYIFTGYYLVSE